MSSQPKGGANGNVLMCIECDDVPAVVICNECQDAFCGLCHHWLHKKGKRTQHTYYSVHGKDQPVKLTLEGTTEHFIKEFQTKIQEEEAPKDELRKSAEFLNDTNNISTAALVDRLKNIPLRLNAEERSLLKLLEGALEISEYTDKVDVSRNDYGWGFGFYSFSSYSRMGESDQKSDVIKRELKEVFSLLLGLYTATNLRKGKQLVSDRNFQDNQEFFQNVFEIGRRFKIMNPDKMRTNYGKLMHLLQDAVAPGMINFPVIAPIKTVYRLIKQKNAVPIIEKYKEDIVNATYVIDYELDATRDLIQQAKERKEKAIALLKADLVVQSKIFTLDEFELIINSISDFNSYVASNCYPVECAINLLATYFHSEKETQETSLAIRAGSGGSCLSHSHCTQFQFVSQSLLLWREIQQEMCRLWINTDDDLLDPSNRYRLCNTGQGMNRVQSAPRISASMSSILRKVQSQLGGWIGLSVVHLGDRDVPNALVFIDKYTQVPRILSPIVRTIQNLESLVKTDKQLRELVDHEYEGIDVSRLVIIRDFFRHGFDGSGDDGGSCIDGRLTSAWNWTALLEKKEYFNLFKLGGFEGFDGSFKR